MDGLGKSIKFVLILVSAIGLMASSARAQTEVRFELPDSTVAESAGDIVLNIISTGATTVSITPSNTATNTVDYTLSTTTLNFLFPTTLTVTVSIIDDISYEPTEYIYLELTGTTSGGYGTTRDHTITLTDNDSAPTIQFTSSTGNGSEGSNASMELSLSTVSGYATSVDYAVSGGTATSGGTDYTLASATATIPAGQSTTNIVATVIDDTRDESDETIIVSISNPVNAQGAIPIASHTYTINDNDNPPEIAFASSTSQNAEGSTAVTVGLELSAVSGKNVSVNYSISGTATGVDDHNLVAGTANIAAGQTTQDISMTVVDDVLNEDDETIIITLSSPTNAALSGTDPIIHTYTIQDDDPVPTVAFNTATANGTESATPVSVQVDLSAVAGRDVTVDYAVNGGLSTATGADYTLASGTATITAGNLNQTFNITVNDDVLDEDNETVVIDISNPTNASLGATVQHTYTINDDDASPNIQFSSTTSSASESAGTVNIPLQLSAISGRDVDVNYSATGGTATGGSTDYTLAAGTATISAGAITTNISVALINESLYEVDETVIVTISGPVNATAVGNTTHTLTITNEDTPPIVQFTQAASSGSEGTANPTYEISINAVSGVNVTVDYSAGGGDAVGSGSDYTLAPGTATITAGLLTTTITTTTIADDGIDENNETFIITLSNESEATIGTNSTHTYTITDNDATPTIEFSAGSSSGAESASPVVFTINLNTASGLDATVDYALTGTATGGGTDYILVDGTATITAGNTSTTVSATIVDDAIDENNETIILTLSSPANALLGTTYPVYTYTITDNDAAPTIFFSPATSNGSEATTSVTLPVVLSAVSGLDVIYDYAISGGTATGGGTDYTFTSTSDTILAGATTASIPLTVVDDPYDEVDETVIVDISNPTNATLGGATSHTYTINDDDLPPTAQFATLASAGDENITPADLKILLSRSSNLPVSVSFTVTGGTATGGAVDYSLADGTVNISAGDTVAFISPVIVDNNQVEADKTIEVTLSAGPTNATLGANTVHTYTILNDDNPPPVFTVATVAITGGTVNTGYWNATNIGLDVTVPVANDPALNGGSIQLTGIIGTDTTAFGAAYAILGGDLGSSVTLSRTAAQLEGITGFAESAIISISAIMSDAYGNSTDGTASSDVNTVDQTVPAAFTVGEVNTAGGNPVAFYWNETTTSAIITVPLSVDNTLENGTVQLRAEADGSFEDLSRPDTIQASEITAGLVNISVADVEAGATGIEELSGFSDGDEITVSAIITDQAGNSTTGTISDTTLIVDQSPPSAAITYTDTLANEGHTVTFTVTFDEAATATPQMAIAYAVNVIPAADISATADPAVWTHSTVILADNDGVVTLSVTGNDLAGNALAADSLTNTTALVIDNTNPGYVLSYSDSLVRATDVVDITATFNESAQTGPTISVDYTGTVDDIVAATMLMAANDSVWTYQITIPTDNDGVAAVTVASLDLAGNSGAVISGDDALTVDNTPPTITVTLPDSGDYVASTAVSYTLNETAASGSITWTRESGSEDLGSPHQQTLTAAELAPGIHSGELTDVPTLAIGTVYEVSYLILDFAGNPAADTTASVTYDPSPPSAVLSYADNQGASDTLAAQGDTIVITADMNEQSLAIPQIAIDYTGNGSDVSATAMTATLDSTIYSYEAIIPSGNDGYATVTITADDLAGNTLITDSTSSRTDLLIDNTPAGYTLAYTDSLVKAGDPITITATFAESASQDPAPLLAIDYFGATADTDSVALIIGASDSVWTYSFTAPVGNDGFATVTVTGTDLAGNPFVNISGSTNTLKVDNTAPSMTVTSPDSGSYHRTTAVAYSLGETITSGTITWTRVGGSADPVPHVQDLDSTELSLGSFVGVLASPPALVQGGIYTLQFLAVDEAGNVDTNIVAAVTYDTLPPVITAAVVADSLAATDMDSTITNSILAAHYYGFTDASSPIALYEYAIGSTSGDTDVVAWTANGTDTTFTDSTLNLTYKAWYYVMVRATDAAGNVSDSVVSDGIRTITKPRLTVSVVQNSALPVYLKIFINDTLGMANNITITADSVQVTDTEIDTFTYLVEHKITAAGQLDLEVLGSSAAGDTTITAAVDVTLAKHGTTWLAKSTDRRFSVEGAPASLKADRYLLVVDSTVFAPGESKGGLYRIGTPAWQFDEPAKVRLLSNLPQTEAAREQAIYILDNGHWRELPSVEEGDVIVAWTDQMGQFKLGKRTITIPLVTALRQNYPNPFNPSTTIVFDLGFLDGPEQKADVVIYDLLGRQIKTLQNGTTSAGRYEIVWQGIDARGIPVASGLYFVRLMTSTGHISTKKMLLVR